MIKTKQVGMLGALGLAAGLQVGCIAGSTAEGSWGVGIGHAWQTTTTDLTIEASGLTGLEVRTHNGTVSYDGGANSEIKVAAKKTASGITSGQAQAALDAMEVYVEDTSDGRKKLAWRWSTPKSWNWGGGVSFEIDGPAGLGLDVETHNGSVSVGGVAGDVKAVTHNGSVVASSSDGSLIIETHNGRIEADYDGPSISLATSNGGVDADLSDCGSVAGDIVTNNGGVRVTVGAATATNVDCTTYNGGIHAGAGIDVQKSSRHRLEGTVGAGGSPLKVRTHNGGIRLKKAG